MHGSGGHSCYVSIATTLCCRRPFCYDCLLREAKAVSVTEVFINRRLIALINYVVI